MTLKLLRKIVKSLEYLSDDAPIVLNICGRVLENGCLEKVETRFKHSGEELKTNIYIDGQLYDYDEEPSEVTPKTLEVETPKEAHEPVGIDYLPTFIPRKLADLEYEHIMSTLEYCGGNRRKASELLGISERTIYRTVRGK